MLKRIGSVTVATKGVSVGVYINHTPYRTSFVGFNLLGRWHFGGGSQFGAQAFACGPFIVGRYDLERALGGGQ